MIETPSLTTVAPQITAVIRLVIPRSEIQHVMGPGIQELMGVVAAQGIGPIGAWFSHHLRMDPDVFDFEIGVPVSAPVAPSGRVVAGQLPAGKVAHTVLHGGYEGLGTGWGEFIAWIESQGLTSASNFWECYSKGPESSSNPADWRTDLFRPVSG